MGQSDKEELLYGNTGRESLQTLKKTQEIFPKLFNRFLDLGRGSWELIST